MTVTEQERAQEMLAELVYSIAGVKGALMASLDGRPIAADLPTGTGEKQTAAFVASAFGLGHRIAELVGPAGAKEILVSSTSGVVIIYSVGDRAALVVLGGSDLNLALLNRKAREVATQLLSTLDTGMASHS